MNQKLKDVFKGKVVNKALTINTGVDEFPRYVVEYLIDNYCIVNQYPMLLSGGMWGTIDALRRSCLST